MRALAWLQRAALSVALLLAGAVWLPHVALGGPPPMDPRAMSGMPRRDAQIPGATITVRVLRGSFSNPALEHPVELKLTNAAGTESKTLTQQTLNQGRATFKDLQAWVGGRAIAQVELDGETLRSAPIDITGDIGTAVMLVSAGDATGSPRAAPTRAPAGGAPMPGVPFEFDNAAPGELMVGTFDLSKKQAVRDVTVVLRITTPQGQETTQSKVTDVAGKVVFDGLDTLPPGTKLVAQCQFSADEPLRSSEPFEPMPGKGMAVVLAKGRIPKAAADPHAQAQRQRSRVPGPRALASLAQGTVRVKLIDGNDRPVPDQEVVVVMIDASQTEVTILGMTDATGVALVKHVQVRSDAFYVVRVRYDQGPYRSGFFQMDKAGGIAVDLRVFETTQDPAAVQSAVQYEIRESENDHAQVYRIFEVVVRGDKAYWAPGGLRVPAPEDAKSVTVLRPAEPWLQHETSAPYATLSRPIPPGEPVHLSMAWVEEHSGEIEVSWLPPFELMQAGVIVKKGFSLEAPGATKSDRKPPDDEVELWDLDASARPVAFTMSGLPTRDPTFRYIAIVLGSGLAMLALGAVVVTPRRTAVQRLQARRDDLLRLLQSEMGAGAGVRRSRIVAALDRVYRQIDALRAVSERPAPKGVNKPAGNRATTQAAKSTPATSASDKSTPSAKSTPSDKTTTRTDKDRA